jgi:hypothetical protein
VPGGQTAHDVIPTVLYRPGGHNWQLLVLKSRWYPLAQRQTVLSALAVVLVGQTLQLLATGVLI